MESVSSLIGDLELQVLDVLAVGVAGWAIERKVGLKPRSAREDGLRVIQYSQ
jgi:hypothetical protein